MSELPTGTVTFLFTDLEGSTRLWERHSVAMHDALARHDEILRRAVEACDGRVVKTTGDGVHAVFVSADNALRAAVDAQRALTRESWEETGPLRVRMGVHSGTAQRRGGDYYGTVLNRAARLMSVGSGAQVLCSQATADLVADLPNEVTLVDLGEHRLADLTQPERVFQVEHAALVSDFPPLRSLGVHRHNLPAALTAFVGRAAEIKELDQLLESSRLVTITGTGGVGKTRLALQAAVASPDRYPDGVWMVELAAVRDEALVPFVAAGNLRMSTVGVENAETMTRHICEHLFAKRMLLLFDNCEHLVGAAAVLTHSVLSSCEHITVMATSREILGLPGEVVWRVPPLSLPPADTAHVDDLIDSDAVTLFCERARDARPGFELNSVNAVDVTRICRRLDGIPLALELAAARIRILGVHQVAERLDDCFQLLTGGARTAISRHETLRAALDWSYDLLPAIEQRLLRCLAVFRGSFELDAADAIGVEDSGDDPAGPAPDVVEIVSRLVDKSLVVVESNERDEVRYRLLEPVRQYGAELLIKMGEDQMVRQRHSAFFQGLGDSWKRRLMAPEKMRRVSVDEVDFRAALEWSFDHDDAEGALRLVVALWLPWFFEGTPDALEWLERVVAAAEHADYPEMVEALCGLTLMLRASGRADPGRLAALAREADNLVVRTGDPRYAACWDHCCAEGALAAGHTDDAYRLLERARATFGSFDDATSVSYCDDHLGWVAVSRGQYDIARAHFERCAVVARAHHDDWGGAHALSALAPLLASSGNVDDALQVADEAVAAARRLPARQVLVMTLARAAEVGILAGDYTRAEEFLAELLRMLRDLATHRWVGDALEMVAVTRDARGEPESAAVMFGACAVLREATGAADGARVLTQAARNARTHVEALLGAARFAAGETRGRSLSPELALIEALSNLSSDVLS